MAKRVNSHRGAKLIPAEGQEQVFLWEQTAKHNQVFYRVNRDHPLAKQVRAACADVPKFTALRRLIEETIPVPLITITDREKPDRLARLKRPRNRKSSKSCVSASFLLPRHRTAKYTMRKQFCC